MTAETSLESDLGWTTVGMEPVTQSGFRSICPIHWQWLNNIGRTIRLDEVISLSPSFLLVHAVQSVIWGSGDYFIRNLNEAFFSVSGGENIAIG